MRKDNDEYLYIDGQHYDNMLKSRKQHSRLAFYVSQAKKHGDPVLELACGTGEIAIMIAKEGMSVTGLDFSQIMLDQAIRKSKEINLVIRWIKEDMTHFSLKSKYLSIIMPGAAMNWILSNEDIESCLSCVKEHLTENGRFIFDVFNPDLEILQRDPSLKYPRFEYPNPHGKGKVVVSGSNVYDKPTQINHFKSYYNIENQETERSVKLRMFFPQELDALLYYNGFKIDSKFGSYDEKPFNSDSIHQIVICHKK